MKNLIKKKSGNFSTKCKKAKLTMGKEQSISLKQNLNNLQIEIHKRSENSKDMPPPNL
jgi:hypothetical protein